jgi:hypothetical protein
MFALAVVGFLPKETDLVRRTSRRSDARTPELFRTACGQYFAATIGVAFFNSTVPGKRRALVTPLRLGNLQAIIITTAVFWRSLPCVLRHGS